MEASERFADGDVTVAEERGTLLLLQGDGEGSCIHASNSAGKTEMHERLVLAPP